MLMSIIKEFIKIYFDKNKIYFLSLIDIFFLELFLIL